MIIVGVLVAAILFVPLFSPANAEVSAETEIALEPAAIFPTGPAFVQYLDYYESTGHSNSLELTGEAFEFYVTGMMQESDNSKWETLIAFPLK